MLRTQTQALSENLRIPMGHLKWFAAFHNESHHPHVHLIAYSTVESEGYLTKQGVQKLRSSFAKDIFSQDLLCIYEKQTEHRNRLRSESKDILSEIIAHKQTEIELQKQTVSLEQLREQAGIIIRENAAHRRSMKQALAASSTGIISEFKRRSPSKGWINEAARAEEIPASYEAAAPLPSPS